MRARTRKPVLQAADLFCGAGGFTTGAEQSGRVKVVLAINHWQTAIYTHQANHAGTRHICARIDDVDPRHDLTLPQIDVLLASPECTHFSIARGGRPVDDQRRATPWHVCHWAECKRPRWIIVENVREFAGWGPLVNQGTEREPHWRPDPKRKGETYRAWVSALQSLGYRVDSNILNAADFGAATKRHRLFIVAVREDVRIDTIPWPEPTHAGRWRPASSIIDWQRPCPSIFGRKRPLAEKTLRRIEAGLRKFVGPYVTQFHNGADGDRRNYDPSRPLPTLDTQNRYGLGVPFQFKMMGRSPGLTRGIDEPVPTIVAARENHAIILPYLFDVNHGGEDDRAASIDQPLGTVTTKRGAAIATPFMLPRQGFYDCHRDKPSRSLEEPVPVITANHGPGHIVVPWLCKYYGTGAGATSCDAPIDTLTTKPHFALAVAALIETMRELHVADIGFRMLEADELAAAQGFPAGYYLHGNKADQIRQVGNAVCPPVAKALCAMIAEAA